MNNTFSLKGNIGAIETVAGAKGEFTSVALYVTESQGKDESGTKQTRTTIFQINAFNAAREQLADLNVGDFVELSGALDMTADYSIKLRLRKAKMIKAKAVAQAA